MATFSATKSPALHDGKPHLNSFAFCFLFLCIFLDQFLHAANENVADEKHLSQRVDGNKIIIFLVCCRSHITRCKINKRHLGNWESIQRYPATKKHDTYKIKNKWAEKLNAT